MHLYILVRGIKHQQDRFIKALSEQFVPDWVKNEKGEFALSGNYHPKSGIWMQDYQQVAVRPMELYEVVFPEPELNRVLWMLKPAHKYKKKYKWITFVVDKIASILGLEKCPEVDTTKHEDWQPISKNKHVVVETIGIKKDEWTPDGNEQL